MKADVCAINESWKDREPWECAFQRFGIYNSSSVNALIQQGSYTSKDENWTMQAFCVGKKKNASLPEDLSQITFEQIANYFGFRFKTIFENGIRQAGADSDFGFGKLLFEELESEVTCDTGEFFRKMDLDWYERETYIMLKSYIYGGSIKK